MQIFSGSTPKLLLRLRDEQGVQLDPSDVSVIAEVKIFLYNAITEVEVGRFYLNTAPDASSLWIQMESKTVATGDVRVLLVLSADMTLAAKGNNNTIQVNVDLVDTEVPGDIRVVIKKAKFPEILPAKS